MNSTICRLLLLCSLILPSCNSKLFVKSVVYVEPGVSMRIREEIPGPFKVWVFVDGEWEAGVVKSLPEGAYLTFKKGAE